MFTCVLISTSLCSSACAKDSLWPWNPPGFSHFDSAGTHTQALISGLNVSYWYSMTFPPFYVNSPLLIWLLCVAIFEQDIVWDVALTSCYWVIVIALSVIGQRFNPSIWSTVAAGLGACLLLLLLLLFLLLALLLRYLWWRSSTLRLLLLRSCTLKLGFTCTCIAKNQRPLNWNCYFNTIMVMSSYGISKQVPAIYVLLFFIYFYVLTVI